ncbi:PrgI family protein [Candidatus Falkowbacteria bacterium]|nr:PrgI family protein [Candidatus Falkowbacteria bacterium]NCT55070.1 PrgI family protein [Candidatus Falkowbacteria bacterium]
MQQFVVPQFIDVEAKIIGPITARQFLIFLAATLIIALCYRLLHFTPFLIVTIVVVSLAGTFAFVKINGRAFHYFVLNLLQTTRRPNTRVWNHKIVINEQVEKTPIQKIDYQPLPKREYKKSRLAEISLIVDTSGKYKGENQKF